MHAARAVVALTVGTSIAVWLAAAGVALPGAVNPGFVSTANAQPTANAATQATQQITSATAVAVTAVVRLTDAAVAVSATRQAQAAAAHGTGTGMEEQHVASFT